MGKKSETWQKCKQSHKNLTDFLVDIYMIHMIIIISHFTFRDDGNGVGAIHY